LSWRASGDEQRDPLASQPTLSTADLLHARLPLAGEALGEEDFEQGLIGRVATIREYLSERLIDELHLVIAPVLLGRGENLFRGLDLRALGYECVSHTPGQRALAHVVIRKRDG